MSYRYTISKILPFYLQSLYNPTNLHQLTRLSKLDLTLSVYRLLKGPGLLKALFLFVGTFGVFPKVAMLRRDHWEFRVRLKKRHIWTVHQKYYLLMFAHLWRTPILADSSVNDWMFLRIRNFSSPESAVYEFNVYELIFSGALGFNYFFSPRRRQLHIQQRNYLRMINVPLQYRLGR